MAPRRVVTVPARWFDRKPLIGSSVSRSPKSSLLTLFHSPNNYWDTSSHSGWTPASIDASLDIGPHNAASDPAFAGLQSSVPFDTGGTFARAASSFPRIYLDAPVWPLKKQGRGKAASLLRRAPGQELRPHRSAAAFPPSGTSARCYLSAAAERHLRIVSETPEPHRRI